MATNKPIDPAWAWAAYAPGAGRRWDLTAAGHLYRRAAFGGRWEELQTALTEGPRRTLERLLRPTADLAAFNRAFDAHRSTDSEAHSAEASVAWWLRRMIETPHPLSEQLTLFWHNYFGIGLHRVESVKLMDQYLQLLRRNALGSFATLLEEILDSPAVLLALDAQASRKARPATYLPRILLGQYTLGPGRYAEADVQETARALSGRFVLQNELQHVASEHDGGVKKILGQQGPFAAREVARILLQQPATAETVVRQLYRWLVSETAPPAVELVKPLAADFAKDYNIARLVETMLGSNLFFSPAAYRQKIKGPVEFALGIVRSLEGLVGTLELGKALAGLGQDLYQPPTIKGWPGHRHWINRFALAGRIRRGQELLASPCPLGGELDPGALARKHGFATREAASRFFMDLWLQGDLPESRREVLLEAASRAGANVADSIRAAAALLAASPEFQLA